MSRLLLTTGLLFGLVQAYAQVKAKGPFMYKTIDPIVFPGSYVDSHLHAFFGSDAVTAHTKTSAELQKGCTSAENPNDLSTYWVPTPFYTPDEGKTWEPMPIYVFSAYYNLGETPAEVPIPQNLKLVAGNALAKSKADMVEGAQAVWVCDGIGERTPLDENGFPANTCDTYVQQIVFFPNCVNTETLEVAYKDKRGGKCPSGMKSMPQPRFSIRWDLRKVLPNGWSGTAPFKLACGPAWCSHGDMFMGWTEEGAQNMMATTREPQTRFPIDGALGGATAGTKCKPTDAEPGKGSNVGQPPSGGTYSNDSSKRDYIPEYIGKRSRVLRA
ncbi:secreted protein [Diplocarpon rosae]|nr:secreted protein [Diplocarpon rosae]